MTELQHSSGTDTNLLLFPVLILLVKPEKIS